MKLSYDEGDENFVRMNHEEMKVAQMAAQLGFKRTVVYSIMRKLGLRAKGPYQKRMPLSASSKQHVPKYLLSDPPKAPIVRAKAEYSNSGYEEVKRKYL